MDLPAPQLPGIRFERQPEAAPVQPLRTDIAGFIGVAERGPIGETVRVEGWLACCEMFGDLIDADTGYALRGYFENGGEVAYVRRLVAAPLTCAEGLWNVGDVGPDGKWLASAPAAGGFAASRFRVFATSPGEWANGMRVSFRYRLRGPARRPEVDVTVRPVHGAVEFLPGLPVDNLVDALAAQSRLIRLETVTPAPARGPGDPIGPQAILWEGNKAVLLADGAAQPPDENAYVDGATALAAEREVALMAAPDLDAMPGGPDAQLRILALLAALAEQAHDRQVIAAPPRTITDASAILGWLDQLRDGTADTWLRSLALYHPPVAVRDPLGGIVAPLRTIAPAGHVAGLISRLDRERGAHHTPANAELYQAVDVIPRQDPGELGTLAMAGINPLICAHGNGIVVWGGRTAQDRALDQSGCFLAHRRLVHSLIRAIRRVAEPLVFEVNGPDLWLALVRTITSLLLDAWNAGSLKGDIPEQAFAVRCDTSNNPPESEDSGLVVCDVFLAPAVPMEFITLRIAITREGRLEAIEQ